MLNKFKILGLVTLFFGMSTGLLAQGMKGGSPQMQMNQNTGQKVTDAEIDKIIAVSLEMREDNQKAQQEMMKIIQDNGLNVQKFTQIQQAEANPKVENKASEADMQKYQKSSQEIQKLQMEMQQKAAKKLEEQGLSMQRYQQIMMKMQSSPELQQKMQQEMMKAQGGMQASPNSAPKKEMKKK